MSCLPPHACGRGYYIVYSRSFRQRWRTRGQGGKKNVCTSVSKYTYICICIFICIFICCARSFPEPHPFMEAAPSSFVKSFKGKGSHPKSGFVAFVRRLRGGFCDGFCEAAPLTYTFALREALYTLSSNCCDALTPSRSSFVVDTTHTPWALNSKAANSPSWGECPNRSLIPLRRDPPSGLSITIQM
ncbi:hypothetical protein PVIIG_02955 [Plasmodium vivax India VII]|uniref:Uncharacterized protein n=3 Tax=Plasmodium vivax TaxID=5855 RepID=A0A0J9TIE7_PLAVI|nr:hypothetical protein PVIIG_02955 [Plasmodium vivax India VII]KMZ94567.1 hypothetical protein PVMG_01924 [Plasmodium vivax Mauritania I]KNA01106.1 hypothetical protein PVNG_02559 [Plasmodium vivax North Korean]